jgi:uncharacterized damage-inducible protein DinB
MAPQQKSEIVGALEHSSADVLAAASVPESIARRNPAEGRWSILDCVEHLARVEESFFERIAPAMGAPLPVNPSKEAEIAARMQDRTDRRQAPETLAPTGRFASLADALEQFKAARARLVQFAIEHASGLTSFSATSPRWGVLSGREVLLLLVGHSRRHAAQMRETLTIGETLDQSRDEFLAAANVPESLAGKNPAEGRWSVLDCIEHVAMVEERFLGRLAPPESGSAPPVDPQKEADLTARIPERTNRVQAPEAIHPKGRFATLAEALEHFKTIRARTAQFAKERASDLPSLAVTHPMLGTLNGREAIVLIAAHSRRHAAQMREAAAAVGAR